MLLSVKLPPGVVKSGTQSTAAGRFNDSQFIRWSPEGLLCPMGGWQLHSASAAALTGRARALQAWRDNGGGRWIAAGTHSKLYVMTEAGALSDITPTGFTTGRIDATSDTGYGAGAYGTGTYGTPRPDTGTRLQPTVHTLDTWGQYLVGVSDTDGKIYQWTLDPAVHAATVSGAPTGVSAIVVTPDNILMALKDRTVAWSDQGDNTVWTAAATNQAGDKDLQTVGTLMCGRPMRGQTLLLTTTDAWSAVYLGQPFIYGFNRVGQGCGAISRQALVVNDTQGVWMGHEGFFAYDGSVQAIPCEVRDAVFGDLNTVQKAKITAVHLSRSREVMWFYPSAGSTENDRYVKLNYGLLNAGVNCWDVGALVRTCGVAPGAFDVPLMVDAGGLIYEHEIGFDYGGDMPFAKTGPFKLGKGERMMEVQGLIPDEKNAGDVQVSFEAKTWPNSAPTTWGPYDLTSPTDFLWQADIIAMTYEGVELTDWRVGEFLLDVIPGDRLR